MDCRMDHIVLNVEEKSVPWKGLRESEPLAAWDVLVLRLEKSGVPIEDGPVQRWGAQGNGTSVYFRDPEDNLVEVRYYQTRLCGCLLPYMAPLE